MVDIFYNEIIWNREIMENTNLDNYYLISIILRFTLFSLNRKKILYFVKKMVEFKNRRTKTAIKNIFRHIKIYRKVVGRCIKQ